jgi:hypothetical protein
VHLGQEGFVNAMTFQEPVFSSFLPSVGTEFIIQLQLPYLCFSGGHRQALVELQDLRSLHQDWLLALLQRGAPAALADWAPVLACKMPCIPERSG